MKKQYDVSGTWGFCPDEAKAGVAGEFWKKQLSAEDTMFLPATTAQAKKGTLNEARETGYLTELYPFAGYAWFQKEITIDPSDVGKELELFLERTRMTKLWVDDAYVGEYDSLTTPHRFLIGKYVTKPVFTLTVLVSNVDYPTKGGHLTSPDTQSNWCGILGEMSLRVYEEVQLTHVDIESDVPHRTMKLRVQADNRKETGSYHLRVTGEVYHLDTQEASCAIVCVPDQKIRQQEFEVTLTSGLNEVALVAELGEDAELWSEYHPYFYQLQIEIVENGEKLSAWCGLRQFSVNEHHFLINGTETFLRGKHDGMIFPLVGAAPMDVKEWLRVMGISKSYGINHYRYHTCCPPEAAFLAADLLGIYMEPELPFWGSLEDTGDEQIRKEQEYLKQEGFRMMREYGNHPSFCMMSLGNELWGGQDKVSEILRDFKKADQRHLYTQGSNNFQHFPVILPEEDFWVGVRLGSKKEDGTNDRLIRGSYATCDAPIGYIQLEEPSTRHNYDEAILPKELQTSESSGVKEIEIQYGTGVKKVRVSDNSGGLYPQLPVVGHEIGQYAVYPNFKEIEKYTGVFRARNFEIFRERLDEKGMLDQAEDFFYCSGKLSVQCYKEELEGFLRSKNMAGYQILDIQDFSGQGTALVGILDAFMDNKGHVTKEEWNGFCSDAVCLAQFDSYLLKAGERFTMNPALSYYKQDHELKDAKLQWKLSICADDANGEEVCGKQTDVVSEKIALELEPSRVDTEAVEGEASCRTCVDIKTSAPQETVIGEGSCKVPDGAYGLTQLEQVCVKLPDSKAPEKLKLVLQLVEGEMILSENSYILWMYPAELPDTAVVLKEKVYTAANGVSVFFTEDAGEAQTLLREGKRVLYLPNEVKDSIRGFYCTDFWCYPMFRSISESMGKEVPVGTMGLCVQKEHPALSQFPTEQYSTPQWYGIVSESDCAVLDEVTAKDYRPIVQMIDNFERNHKLGILFEGNSGDGRLMVCTSRLSRLTGCPEAAQFLKSVLTYMSGDEFVPKQEIELSAIAGVNEVK